MSERSEACWCVSENDVPVKIARSRSTARAWKAQQERRHGKLRLYRISRVTWIAEGTGKTAKAAGRA